MRQIVLDTETTGLEPADGHRIIEIGCVELVERRLTGNNLHRYLQPDREIDAGAIAVHGITNEFLVDKPRFADVADELIAYLSGAELIIHNAPFDVGFLDQELERWRNDAPRIDAICQVTDSLTLAREKHPGQRNSLDALCKRYEVDNSRRQLHGALLDAEILADVYLAMTGGQFALLLEGETNDAHAGFKTGPVRRIPTDRPQLPVIRATGDELTAHQTRLTAIDTASDGACVWLANQPAASG